jgi:hypothetical protein
VELHQLRFHQRQTVSKKLSCTVSISQNYRLVAADDSRIVSLDDPRFGIVHHGGNHNGSATPEQ